MTARKEPLDSFARQRAEMVAAQLAARGIRDRRVLAAFRKVPRHLFVPEEAQVHACEDRPLPIGHEQTISQPYMVALMTERLALAGGEKTLEIGTGSGYQTAILAEMGARVFSIERVPQLAERAARVLKNLGCDVRVRSGDGTLGWPEHSPFDRIIVTAGAPAVPPPLVEQLGDRGILVIPVGDSFSQMLNIVRKKDGKVTTEEDMACIFVKLIGEHGWKAGTDGYV